ncbi:MAG: aminotransferase class I/II-fold pyridoxal phosphate-dependent enzyme [Leuconostoc sp.]|uniref:aminotransferase class I/II-fold pyridoxal phosphate-dependent enzyme n=1 Tax=Leuconostoc sp. TaxID=1930076 RepID=UPI0039E9D79C
MVETNDAMMGIFSDRLQQVAPSPIHTFSEAVSDVPNILKLTIGEPDFAVPEHIKAAAVAAIAADDSHYSVSAGSLALRQAAHQFLLTRYALDFQPETEILTTVGATEGLYTLLSAVLNPGDEVLIPTPAYPVYAEMTRLNGGQPLFVDVSEEAFLLTPDRLRAILATHQQVKAMILTNPSNPTGATYTPDELKALAAVLKETAILVISDEIYSELQYDGVHASMATYLPEQTIVVNGVSKSHAMTGYRIGILAGPAALIAQINKVHGFVIMTPSNPAMAAATEAFNCDRSLIDTQAMKAAYQTRRDFLVTELSALGFEMVRPNGAFYIFAKIPADLTQDDVAFAYDLVAREQLAVVAGSGFGPGGEGYIRISYAAAMPVLEEAMSRLKNYVANTRIAV